MDTPKVNTILVKKAKWYMDNQWNHTFTNNKKYQIHLVTDACIYLRDDEGANRWFYLENIDGSPKWYDYFSTLKEARNKKLKMLNEV